MKRKKISRIIFMALATIMLLQILVPILASAKAEGEIVLVNGTERNITELPNLAPGKYDVTIKHNDFNLEKIITVNIYENKEEKDKDQGKIGDKYSLRFTKKNPKIGKTKLGKIEDLKELFTELGIEVLEDKDNKETIDKWNKLIKNDMSMSIKNEIKNKDEILSYIKALSYGNYEIKNLLVRDSHKNIIASTSGIITLTILDDSPIEKPEEKPVIPGGGTGGGSGGSGGKDKPTTPEKPKEPEKKPEEPKKPEDPKNPETPKTPVTPVKPTTPEEKGKVDDYKKGDRSKRDELIGMIIEEQIEYELNKIDHLAYLKGYNDNTVRPEGNVTREEAAMVFYRLMEPEFRADVETKEHIFTDVEKDRWSEIAIATLSNAGMITGYKDGTFKPTKQITRAEVSSMIAKLTDTVILETEFNDTITHWAEDYINSVQTKGWIKGYNDGTFKPNQLIKRSEFTTITNSLLERKVMRENILPGIKEYKDLKEDKWYYEIMVEAINGHKYIMKDQEEIWTELNSEELK